MLFRSLHPKRGMVSPYQFISLAEETGLIIPIGQWVLDTACAQLKAWQQEPLTKALVIAINVSARQFHQVDFVEQVLNTVHKYGINPALLKIELTESMLVNNIKDVITKMNELSKIGISFSLDDFGTGYSSLSYLKRLPLDQLKIDQSFVRDVLIDSHDATICRSIINLANNLGLEVIAEGVELIEQKDFLNNEGCHLYQGYHFSRPLPISQLEQLINP